MATLTEIIDSKYPLTAEEAKEAFKDWLKEIELPDYASIGKKGLLFNSTESIRNLLIALVDEP